ncbi:putative 2-(R)-hydroxypropyl-CoM dehydrogenase [Xylogone sp. PMI_703]|nr:putative 2-(R)-hydroxypropyl-CoM dehydrogenase [Xylogone sp. PMI_703]
MPPPKGYLNPIEGPGDYDVTEVIHNDTYPAIDPTKADYTGKAVLITGASKGLGRAMVLAFAKAGASYIAAGARSDMTQLVQDVEAAAEGANRKSPKFLPVKLDITSQKSVEDAAAIVEKEFGRLDILINNAGIFGEMIEIGRSDPQAWWESMDVNVRGSYLVFRIFYDLLLKTKRSYVVNVCSVAALVVGLVGGVSAVSAYQTSKLALLRVSEFINKEHSKDGIICFAIHPGNVPTDIVGGYDGLSDVLKPVFVETPEIGSNTLVFLMNERREWIGGRYINVTWDMPQLMARKDYIVQGDKLKVKFDF